MHFTRTWMLSGNERQSRKIRPQKRRRVRKKGLICLEHWSAKTALLRV